MSHQHLRTEPDCLNCGTLVTGRYCHNCGQENVEPKENAWHLIVHFFNDFTHFDGKFFSSMKYLLLRPGFLTEEYMKGRRARYLNPIRMYLFISAVFFLLFMTFFIPKDTNINVSTNKGKPNFSISRTLKNTAIKLDTLSSESDAAHVLLKNGRAVTKKDIYNFSPATIAAYDSFQRLLPKEEQDGALEGYFARKTIRSQAYMKENKEEARHRVLSNFFHSMPYILFISLPVFALILQLLYIRRKQFNYVSHGIFIIHYFCVLFIALLLIFILRPLGTWGNIASWVVQVGSWIYLYQAMRNFYKQHWFKTLVKYALLYSLSILFIVFIFSVFMINFVLNVA